MTQEKEKKITKAQRFEDIKALLTSDNVKYGTDIDTALKFIDRELELLARKNSPSNKKVTEEKAKNDHLKELIKTFLATQEEGMTVTQVMKSIPELNDFSNQKIARLMNDLYRADEITKEVVKGRSLYSAK